MATPSNIDNKLFGKLLVDDNSPSSIKKKYKGKKTSKKLSKRGLESSTAEEGSSADENSDASVVLSPEQSVLGQEHTMETVGSQELTEEELTKEGSTKEESTQEELHQEEQTHHELTEQESIQQESTPKELTKRVSTLRIDTQKSNKRSKGKGKGKHTPGSSSSDTGKKDADNVTDHTTSQNTEQRGDDQCGDNQCGGLLPGVQDIARQDVPTEQQLAAVAGQQTVSASRFPTTPDDLTTPFSPSFETARTHLSPRTPLPSSSLSSFFTPTSASWKKDEDEGAGGVKAEGNEPAESSDELRQIPRGDEAGLRYPVSNNRDEVWFSGKLLTLYIIVDAAANYYLDPEEYHGGHEAQDPVLRRSESFDMASLGMSLHFTYVLL